MNSKSDKSAEAVNTTVERRESEIGREGRENREQTASFENTELGRTMARDERCAKAWESLAEDVGQLYSSPRTPKEKNKETDASTFHAAQEAQKMVSDLYHQSLAISSEQKKKIEEVSHTALESLKKIDVRTEQDITHMQALVGLIRTTADEACATITEINKIRGQASTIQVDGSEYFRLKLSDPMTLDDEEVDDELKKADAKIKSIDKRRLSSIRQRVPLFSDKYDRSEAIERLHDLYAIKKMRQKTSIFSAFDLETKVNHLVHDTNDAIAKKLDAYYEGEIRELQSELPRNEKPLPQFALDSLNKEYANRVLEKAIEEKKKELAPNADWYKDDLDALNDEGVISRAREIASQLAANDFNLFAEDEQHVPLNTHISKLPDILQKIIHDFQWAPHRVVNAENEIVPQNEYFQQLGQFAASAPKKLRRLAVQKQYAEVMKKMHKMFQDKTVFEVGLRGEWAEKGAEQLCDENPITEEESKFISTLDSDRWRVFAEDQTARDALRRGNQDIVAESEEALQQLIIKRLYHAKRNRNTKRFEYDSETADKLLELKNTQTAPQALLAAYRNQSYQYPALHKNFTAFIESLDRDELEARMNRKEPGFTKEILETVSLIQKHPEDCNRGTIENPAIKKFEKQLKNDEEFLDKAPVLQNTDVIEVIDDDKKERSEERDGEKIWYLQEKMLCGIVPDLPAQLPKRIAKDNPLFKHIKHTLAQNHLRDLRIVHADVVRTTIGYRDGANVCTVPDGDYERYLQKYGYSPDGITGKGKTIDNPVFFQIQKNLGGMAIDLMRDTEAQNFVLSVLERLPAHRFDPEVYDALADAFEHAELDTACESISESIQELARERSDTATFERLAKTVKPNMRYTRKKGYLTQIAYHSFEGVALQEERDPETMAALSELLQMSPEDIERTADFVKIVLKETSNHLKTEEIKEYAKLSENEGIVELIIDLKAYGYTFEVAHASVLPELIPKKSELIKDIVFLREQAQENGYRYAYMPYYHRTDKGEGYVTDPVELFTLNPGMRAAAKIINNTRDQHQAEVFAEKIATCLLADEDMVTEQAATKPTDLGVQFRDALHAVNKIAAEHPDKAHYQDFFYQDRIMKFIAQHPESVPDMEWFLEQPGIEQHDLYMFCINNVESLAQVPAEKRKSYLEVALKIQNSPSQEIQRLREQLLTEIMETDDPARTYRNIESIFVKNNLPLAGKVFKIFKELYPPDRLNESLPKRRALSPYLTESKNRRRYSTIYKDILRVHIESGNRSLRDYLTILENGQSTLEEAERLGVDNLDEKTEDELNHFLAKLETLFVNSQLGQQSEETPEDNRPIAERYEQIRSLLETRENQTVNERIAEMFLKPTGHQSFREVLETMWQSKQEAHDRGIETAEQIANGTFKLSAGDLIKGVKEQYFGNILNNGSVAKEYLGASSSTDQTPFDTDVSRVLPEDVDEKAFATPIKKSLSYSGGYGNLLLLLKDRGAWQVTEQESVGDYTPDRLELFQTGADRHYGIRTGFPMIEVDAMVAHPLLINNERALKDIYVELAQNGYYIPVADEDGSLLFSPDQYAAYRHAFDGLERFDGSPLDVVVSEPMSPHGDNVQRITKENRSSRERVNEASKQIKKLIRNILSEYGIELKSEFDTSLLGAELHDTGSTGRSTNMPGDFDFDLVLRLDVADYTHVHEINQRMINALQPKENKSHPDDSGDSYQLRAIGATGIGSKPIDIDIAFVKKSELQVFGTHDAIQKRLEHVRENQGEEAYESVVANVIAAKQVLKQGNAYKKVEHGGFGGVGVENWILANHGNLLEACRTFYQASHTVNGEVVPFDEFQKNYPLIDPGVNVKFKKHDDYVYVLKETGYQAMIPAVENYLKKNNTQPKLG